MGLKEKERGRKSVRVRVRHDRKERKRVCVCVCVCVYFSSACALDKFFMFACLLNILIILSSLMYVPQFKGSHLFKK